jgi:hypothetical protein
MKRNDLPLRKVNEEYSFVYYHQEPKDRLPHRGLLSRMNAQSLKGWLVIYNPGPETTAIFGSRHLPKDLWRRFVERLMAEEGDSVWYVPTGADGSYANFVLNGTESYRGVPKSKLDADGLFQVLRDVVNGSNSLHS